MLLRNLVVFWRKQIKKIKKHDALIVSLNAEIKRLKTIVKPTYCDKYELFKLQAQLKENLATHKFFS